MWPDGVYERQFIEAERGEEPTATWLLYSSTTVLQGLPERIIKEKQFSRVLIFAKVRYSQLF